MSWRWSRGIFRWGCRCGLLARCQHLFPSGLTNHQHKMSIGPLQEFVGDRWQSLEGIELWWGREVRSGCWIQITQRPRTTSAPQGLVSAISSELGSQFWRWCYDFGNMGVGLKIWGSCPNDKLVVSDTGKWKRRCLKWESYDKDCEKSLRPRSGEWSWVCRHWDAGIHTQIYVNRLATRGLPPGAIVEPVRALDCGKLGNWEI